MQAGRWLLVVGDRNSPFTPVVLSVATDPQSGPVADDNCAQDDTSRGRIHLHLDASIPMNATTQKPPLLDFHNLRVMRGQKVALDDFSLRIGADEHVAVLGPNGCGKSTLIKTITRECYPVARPDSSMSI